MTSITRRYQFPAGHRLHSPDLSAAENARLYGKCNNPFGHGHNYVLEVTVTGQVDPLSGLILPVRELDRLVETKILKLFSHRNLNLDVPQFQILVPTTENIVSVIKDILLENWCDYLGDVQAHLRRVYIQETARNEFEIVLPIPSIKYKNKLEAETVHA